MDSRLHRTALRVLTTLATLGGSAMTHAQAPPVVKDPQETDPNGVAPEQAPPFVKDPQETNPNVGLFRLPAHRGGADALAGPEGFGFLSKDNDFGMMLHPVLQADARYQLGTLQNDADRSKFLVAFAGLALTARFYERIRSELLVNFSSSTALLSQAWLDVDATPWLHVKLGLFPFPISFERTSASIFFPFVAADLPSALLPSTDTGAQLWGAVADSTLTYNLAIVSGAVAGTGGPQVDPYKHVVGRVVVSPFANGRGPGVLEGLAFGAGGSDGTHHGTATNPELPQLVSWSGHAYFAYRTGTAPGTTVVSTGETYRVVPQVSWHAGPLSAYAELAFTRDHADGALVTSTAWGTVVTAVLTGENALPLHYVVPAHNFSTRTGYIGALEVVAGGGALDVRDDGQLAARLAANAAMRAARTYELGLNWYPNLGVRVMLDAERTRFLPIATVPSFPDENLIVGRFQVVL
jgi:phosphate-selective porin